ncbi:hypothetical protein ADZ37_09895 [Pannonibacter phragmitetus]|uniref:hypothetical protein n=1 Tax=Pannonibacter phragmitetus TaxID=121719 RepID=UPI00067C9E48|nr:hypothetical protein [Pannonibacter phragmitetus]KND19315.1 hypothetical protein ADZ37_09895 [Pannonibacter phragmitetus]
MQIPNNTKPSYKGWLAAQKTAALARGGEPLRMVPGSGDREFPHMAQRRKGEIINPLTGEVVTGCLTASKLSGKLGLSSQKVYDLLEKAGALVRVLRAREVPMICAPWLTKPAYEHVPEVTREGVEDGLVIPIAFSHGGRETQCILITPKGQAVVSAALAGKTSEASSEASGEAKRPGKVETKKQVIRDLLAAGHSQAAVVRQTGWPKQTVSRLVRMMEDHQ